MGMIGNIAPLGVYIIIVFLTLGQLFPRVQLFGGGGGGGGNRVPAKLVANTCCGISTGTG